MHPRTLSGVPDFAFDSPPLALFVDGCFWHGCPRCLRPLPTSNRRYWVAKIQRNVERAREVERALADRGVLVMRIWEHDLRRTSSAASVAALVAERIRAHRSRVGNGEIITRPARR
jgi:DNA mismatch endonuclease (patch repair protein)